MWAVSAPLVVQKSRFVGRAIRADTIEKAARLIKELKASKDTAKATHNISACRIRTGAHVYEEAYDNGEPPAAQRMLFMLKQNNVENVVIVVTRWYGGVKLGPKRFQAIDQVAKESLELLSKEDTCRGSKSY